MLQYLDTLDEVNAKILEGLGRHGPRNVSSLAKELKLSPTTVAFRISKLVKEKNLQTRARLRFQNLGLSRAVVIAESKPGKEKTLQALTDNALYWTYKTRCFGKYNGVYALFGFPVEHKRRLEDYFAEAQKQGFLDNYALYWVTDFCEVPPNFNWFNFKKRSWGFQWQQWMKEIERASKETAKKCSDAETYPVLADKVDLLLLKELEKDGAVEFNELAKIVGMTPEAVRYRFQNHILKRKLIADYEISIFPYPYQSSDQSSFVVEFRSRETLAKFANSLTNKPFVLNYAKVTGQNELIVHFYTPRIEFTNLIDSLNNLIEMNFVERFFHVLLDIPSFKRQTVSYEFFERNRWVYDYKSTMENWRKIVAK